MKIHVKPLLTLWEWQDHAACRGMDSTVFFSPPGERGATRAQREENALAVCSRCPVQNPCGRFAVTTGRRYVVRGSVTEMDLKADPRVPDAGWHARGPWCRRTARATGSTETANSAACSADADPSSLRRTPQRALTNTTPVE
ncbi:WhiB family transcriptional regulator [Streptomyces sp. NPDC048411]|uniref:WhiB family transcriptional regulator n=1 Tax=Streptomyces sp. NPDC048411 TaxID=3157206 RepID=UPI003452832E